MKLEITDAEKETLLFFLHKAKIEAEGMLAIGCGSKSMVINVNSIIKKLKESK